MMTEKQRNSIRLVQISDSHLFADPARALLGIHTEDSLRWVVEQVQHDQLNPQIILATGDIAQDASLAAYNRFKQHLHPLNAPIYWLPGNHDQLEVMAQVVEHPQHLSPCVIEQGVWRIILLDSAVPGEVWGHLAQAQLDFLQRTLANTQTHHVMICLHHHPLAMGSEWIDEIGLKNSTDFFSIIDAHACVKAIVWGHVHQAFEAERKGVQYFSTPSTCIQFKPHSKHFELEGYPGYRWFDLFEDGGIHSEVVRITPPYWNIDVKAGGY